MNATAETITYDLLIENDSDEMSKLLGEVFAERDPPAVAAGITAPEFEAFVSLFCPKASAEGLTIVARSSVTGEMVGAMLAEDAGTAPPDTLDHISPTFAPVLDILGQLDADYRSSTTIRPGEFVHLFLIGVAREFAGMGIAQQLVTRCLENAVQKDYSRAITEATNKTSQQVFRKLGFVDRVQRSYADHRFEGQSFFTSISDHGGPILMDKLLVE